MLTKIKLVDGTIIEADTVRENYFPGKNNKGLTQVSIIVDSPKNIGSIEDFKTKFTPKNLELITAITGENVSQEFVGYTVIANLQLTLTSTAFHYEFSFVRPVIEDIAQA